MLDGSGDAGGAWDAPDARPASDVRPASDSGLASPCAGGAGVVEAAIVQLVAQQGPLTGAEIRDALGDEPFAQWKACMLSPQLVVRRVGTRYLRLDQKVEGYARLSPSILREYLTYSVVGLANDPHPLETRANEVMRHIQEVTQAKLELARGIVGGIGEGVGASGAAEGGFCVIIAGDIVYDMAHDVPRPERSTGRLVRGSDLDLVVVVDDGAPEELIEVLDEAIYRQKYRTLINPAVREEIDYIVKPLGRLREQAQFDTFKKMVACKILHEGVLLYGDRKLFDASKALLSEYGVLEQLDAMESAAVRARAEAETALLATDQAVLEGDELYLFYTAEESEEFE